MRKALTSITLALSIILATFTAATPAESLERRFYTYYTTSTNSFEFGRLKQAAPYYKISPRFHRHSGVGIIGRGALYINGKYQRTLKLDHGRVTFRIYRSDLRDNEVSKISVRLVPINPRQRVEVARKWIIDRPVGWRVVEFAKMQRGKPYRWAADGPGSFDCSGLVVFVYRNVTGRRLPHYSGALRYEGRRVSSPRKGDIVWTRGHVSIYAGNGYVIEAASPGTRVRMVPRWQRGPVYIRL